ncbi:aminoglycoside phosphotransferase family protein [Cyclobacterium sp.]|uniref:phosphotransferase enzyme family protein n=1 Tax=Cyclobacterium sp. TaxID=1966343 RepID=UPI0019984063|nr:aminoglycoside phosphotransferase family protein [Cyclobacterium sp.]MBD3626823.1 aminoglycoside phosphotransferase family protein [Cyclobacterium sp.]
MKEGILNALKGTYGLPSQTIDVKRFGSGHIHKTYRVFAGSESYILQAFNDLVFKYPERISGNQQYLMDYFDPKDLPFSLPLPIVNDKGHFFTDLGGELYRLFPFVNGITKDAIEQADQAERAAEAFAYFILVFLQADAKKLEDTIVHFHDLNKRFEQFDAALKSPKIQPDGITRKMIAFYDGMRELQEKYQAYRLELPLRVTHNDTKINNLIFGEDMEKVNALIDLDTIMAGYVFYDFGDLVRTVACTQDESSLEWDSIQVDMDKYEGLLKGFYGVLGGKLLPQELESLPYGGEMMTLIMGLRFLTDHLNGNVYYQVDYPEQNLHRAQNQAALLRALIGKRGEIEALEDKLKHTLSL